MIDQAAIDDLVKRYPLPDGVPDAVLQKGELAQFMGVTLPTIESWIVKGMPVLEAGNSGRPWRLQASHVYAWRQSWLDEEQARSDEARAAIAAMRLKLIDGEVGDSIQGLPPRERKALYEVELAHRQLLTESNQLMPRDKVRELLEEMFSLIRDTATSMSDRCEREAGLTGEQIETIDRIGENLLEQLELRIAEFFQMQPVDQRPRSDRDLFNQ